MNMNLLRVIAFSVCVAVLLAEADPVQHESDQIRKEASDPEKKETEKANEKEEMNEFDREHEAAGILTLTDDTFDAAIASHSAVLVKFFAPWCIHSRALAPEFLQAAMILKAKNSPVRLARVDASLEKKLEKKFDVKGFPTLKYIKGDSVIDYSGGKTSKSIVSWAEAKLQPATITLTTVEEADKFVASQTATILGFFKSADKAKVLEDAAFTRLGELPVGVTDSEELMAHFGVADETIVLFQNIDNERKQYRGPFDVEGIAGFVKENKLPLVVEFSHANAPDIFGGNVTKHLLLFARKSKEAEFKASFGQLRVPAQAFKGRVLFIYVDTDVSENEKILQFFGVAKDDPPSVRMIALDMNMSKFKPAVDTVSSEELIKFVEAVLKGEMEPHLPSQELPADWDQKPVKVLVTSNFDKVTMDQSTTAFVMFYAPWCDHSKELAPVWDQLAESYASNGSIVIAKMDSSANELPDMKILTFPTLKLFPANTNDVLDFSGMDRSLEKLRAFVDAGGRVKKEVPKEDAAKGEEAKKKTGEEGSVVEDEEGEGKQQQDQNTKQEL